MKTLSYFMLFLTLAFVSQAVVTMTAGDAIGGSSFNTAGKWSDGLAPSAGKTYSAGTYLLRTPAATGNYTFAGDSLTIGGGVVPFTNATSLINKTPTGAGVTITVNNLILDAGYIRDGMGSADVWTLAGNIFVTANGCAFANQCRLNVNSAISGSGPIYADDNGSGEAARTTYINSALNTYSGNITLRGTSAVRCRLTFSAGSRMNFVIGAKGVNNSISGTGTAAFDGNFNFDLAGASIKVGDSWTIASATSQTFGATFTVIGFTAEADGITWTKGIGDGSTCYEFNKSTGILAVKVRPPHSPDPADLATNVLTSLTTLKWKGGQCTNGSVDPNIVKYYVYTNENNFAQTEPNMMYPKEVPVGTVADASYTLGTPLQTDKTVYWRVEQVMNTGTGAKGDPNNVMGPIWRFATQISIPVVPANQPVSVRVFPGEPNAVFTVNFSSLSNPTVKWYKNNNATVTEITAGVTTINNGSGNYTTTLTFGTSFTVSDEGQYYCTVTNLSGPTVYQSGVADLVVKRLLAEYDFNGTLTPAAGSSADAPTGTGKSVNGLADANSLQASTIIPAYVAGIDSVAAHALRIDPNQYVDFTVNGYPKANPVTSNGYGGGLDAGTIVYWVKPNVAAYQVVLGNFNDTVAGVGFLSALQANGDEDLLIRNGGPYLANHVAARPNRPEYNLTDGKWHMMAACWSGNTSTLYVDGQWVGSNTDSTPTSYAAWQRGTLLGASRQAARHLLSDMFRGGAIDNLRIYNYRLDASSVEVFAQEYMNTTGIRPCTNMSFAGNAYNFDNNGSSYCRVDFADFAVFAGAWLADGLF